MNKLRKSFSAIGILLGLISLAHTTGAATAIYQVNETKGTFLQVPLDHEVYTYSKQPNLQDLLVLDADKNPLPYRFVSVAAKNDSTEEKIISDSLHFFPVAVDASPDTLRKLHTTQVAVRGNNIQIATSDKTLDNTTPEFYLIDISQLHHSLTGLSIDWAAQTSNDYLEVELEATRNLQDWFSLATATLVQINQQEQSLKRNHIDVNIAKKDYEFLRLRILRGAEHLQITQVIAEQKLGAVPEKIAKETWAIKGLLAKTQSTVYLPNSHSKSYPVTAWEFTRNENTPIDSLSIDFGSAIYGDSAKIFSRAGEDQHWQLQHQGIWFNALVGSQWQKSNPVTIYANRDKFWRIELNDSAKNISAPNLVFGWQPTQLQIITNNKPPYLLAVDNQKNMSFNGDQVFNQILAASTPVWVSTGLTKLNIQPDDITQPKKPVDWKQWLFWVALLLAVGVLLGFSLKLFKQLKASNSD